MVFLEDMEPSTSSLILCVCAERGGCRQFLLSVWSKIRESVINFGIADEGVIADERLDLIYASLNRPKRRGRSSRGIMGLRPTLNSVKKLVKPHFVARCLHTLKYLYNRFGRMAPNALAELFA